MTIPPQAQHLIEAAARALRDYIPYGLAAKRAAEVSVVTVLRELAGAEAIDVALRLRALADSIEKGGDDS